MNPIFILNILLLLPSPTTATKNPTFIPSDNYRLSCGSPKSLELSVDGRTFRSEPESSSFLSTDKDIRLVSSNSSSPSISPLYQTARIFTSTSTYSFHITKLGLHFIRLHFFAFPSSSHNLSSAIFTVNTEDFLLLHDFSLKSHSSPLLKEHLINIRNDHLCLTFRPKKGSFAFLNAVELVSPHLILSSP